MGAAQGRGEERYRRCGRRARSEIVTSTPYAQQCRKPHSTRAVPPAESNVDLAEPWFVSVWGSFVVWRVEGWCRGCGSKRVREVLVLVLACKEKEKRGSQSDRDADPRRQKRRTRSTGFRRMSLT